MSLNFVGEVDSVLRDAIKVLHSPNESGEKIRMILDELIKVTRKTEPLLKTQIIIDRILLSESLWTVKDVD